MADRFEFDSRLPRPASYRADLWRFRELLFVLASRDVAVRYRQTVLGLLWVVLQPLGLVAVFTLIFGRWGRIDTGQIPYHLFVLSGLLPWMFFASSLAGAANSILRAEVLISKVYFPRLIIPLAALGAPLVDAIVAFTLLALLIFGSGFPPATAWLLVPPLMCIAVLAAVGVGALIAALAVRYRDFHQLLPFLISAWMFLTPIIYPPSWIPSSWQWLLALNPMAGVVTGVRAAMLDLPLDTGLLFSSTAVALLLCTFGVRYFVQQEERFADII